MFKKITVLIPGKYFQMIILVVFMSFVLSFLYPAAIWLLWITTMIGSYPTLQSAFKGLRQRKITIEAFNSFALLISLVLGEIQSAAFIVLMLSFAAILDERTKAKASAAIEALIKLKPHTVKKETGGSVVEMMAGNLAVGDIVIVENGERIGVDGQVLFGMAYVDESSLTGESQPVEKKPGSDVSSGTLVTSGVLKVKAQRIGEETTIARMAKLVAEAAKNKSDSEKLADRFATVFLPVVLVLGIITYFLTRNPEMTAAIFLVACADDVAVSIPLAMAAAIGRAAKRGVIVKGGKYFEALGKVTAVVFDKTGTLTYGRFAVKSWEITSGVNEHDFWKYVGISEKYSEHPAGKALFAKAKEVVNDIPDPEQVEVFGGSGLKVQVDGRELVIGEYSTLSENGIEFSDSAKSKLNHDSDETGSKAVVLKDKELMGTIMINDIPREESKHTIEILKKIGVKKTVMFTGDSELVAKTIAAELGIADYIATMRPEEKLEELTKLTATYKVVMVGDGVNDAPSLSRAHVGIAMGTRGSDVAVESADLVILTDNLSRIPEMITLSRKVTSVINWNMILWAATNGIGFLFVFTGVFGPAFAAFYNFVTDFFPVLNSTRLYRENNES